MRNEEITAMKNDLPFYVQKVINIMVNQLPMMPKAVTYEIAVSKLYGFVATVRDDEDGFYIVHPGGEVHYIPGNKLSAMVATTTDEEQHS